MIFFSSNDFTALSSSLVFIGGGTWELNGRERSIPHETSTYYKKVSSLKIFSVSQGEKSIGTIGVAFSIQLSRESPPPPKKFSWPPPSEEVFAKSLECVPGCCKVEREVQ